MQQEEQIFKLFYWILDVLLEFIFINLTMLVNELQGI